MIDTNLEAIQGAFKRLSQAAINERDDSGQCTVRADDISSILMALTFERGNVEELQKQLVDKEEHE